MTALMSEPRVVARASTIVERRDCPLEVAGAEVRATEGGARSFVGHASVFNSRTAIGNPLQWGWYEEIDEAAFNKTLAEADVRFLIDHDSRMVVARKSAGDLRLSIDSVGLAVDADLDTELSYVRDLVRNLEKRRITGMSFGFYVVRDEWSVEQVETSDGQTADVEVRRILEVRLIEVSAVTFPAYEDTDAGVRSALAEIRSERLGDAPDSSPDAHREAPAPVDETTRDETDSTPADEATSDLRNLQLRALAQRARAQALR